MYATSYTASPQDYSERYTLITYSVAYLFNRIPSLLPVKLSVMCAKATFTQLPVTVYIAE